MLCSTLQAASLQMVGCRQRSIIVLYLTYCSASSTGSSGKYVNLCHHPSGNMERQAEAGRRYRVQSPRIWRNSFTRYHSRHSSFQWRGNHLLCRVSSSSCRHWRYPARLNASPFSRTVSRRSGYQIGKARIRGQLQREKNNGITLR